MRVFITARYKGATEHREAIEAMCAAVREAGMKDFCFIRDVENYQQVFDNPHDLWQRARKEITESDALLIDVSDMPTTGRVIEAGMAFALGKPVFVIAQNGIDYKDVFDGIAACVIRYETMDDIVRGLADYAGKST